jgi:hypothetical protein
MASAPFAGLSAYRAGDQHDDDRTYRGSNDLRDQRVADAEAQTQSRQKPAAHESAYHAAQQVFDQSATANDKAGQPAGDKADVRKTISPLASISVSLLRVPSGR